MLYLFFGTYVISKESLFTIYELPLFPGKYSKAVSRCLLDSLEFRVVILLDRLAPKAKEISVPRYLNKR